MGERRTNHAVGLVYDSGALLGADRDDRRIFISQIGVFYLRNVIGVTRSGFAHECL